MMLEQQGISDIGNHASVEADLDRALMTAFCRALETSHLPPVVVMRVMAEALGSVYRQVADAHQNQQCPCGWQPAASRDISLLQSALKAAATRKPADLLSTMTVLGRA
jgi:hypothetical protein